MPTPTIKVTTRLVQVNVLVHDHHGNPISDLTKDDFEITDQGRVEQVSLFTVDSVAPSGKSGTAAKPSLVLPRNVVTNRPEKQADTPTSVTVLLLDMYNTKLTDQMYARKQMLKFLRQIRPEDRVAIYLLQGQGFSIVHDFTNNSESLMASLGKVFPGFSHQLDGSDPDPSNTGNDDMDSFIDTNNTIVSNFFTRNRVLNTCVSFKVLAQHLTGVPGRKNVVWVSGGFPIAFGYGDEQDKTDSSDIMQSAAASDREMFTDYIEAASQAMNTANVAVYPVDARGLMGLPFADASKNVKVGKNGQLPNSMMRVDTRNMQTMDYIADLTGGKAFYNTNDIGGAIRHAIDDSAVTYTLGYYASDENWDNKFHKIKVKVKRGGVVVRTKKGYLAQEQPAPNPGKLDQLLREAIWSPLDSTALGVSARIDPSPTMPNASRLFFALDPNEIQFKQANDKFNGAIDVVFVQQTKRGKSLADLKKTLNLSATADRFAVIRSKALTAGEDLALRADTDAVRIVVLDRSNGSTGSVTIPVTAQDKSGATVAPAAKVGQASQTGKSPASGTDNPHPQE